MGLYLYFSILTGLLSSLISFTHAAPVDSLPWARFNDPLYLEAARAAHLEDLTSLCGAIDEVFSRPGPRRGSLVKPAGLPSIKGITEYYWPPFTTGNMATLRANFPDDPNKLNYDREHDRTPVSQTKIMFGKWKKKDQELSEELGFLEVSQSFYKGPISHLHRANLTTYNKPGYPNIVRHDVQRDPVKKDLLLQMRDDLYSYVDGNYMGRLKDSPFIPRVYKALWNPDMASSYVVTENLLPTTAEHLLKGWVERHRQNNKEIWHFDPLEAMSALGKALKAGHDKRISKGPVNLSDLMPRLWEDGQFHSWTLVNWGQAVSYDSNTGDGAFRADVGEAGVSLLLLGVPDLLVENAQFPDKLKEMMFENQFADNDHRPSPARVKDYLKESCKLDTKAHPKFYDLVTRAISKQLDIDGFLTRLESLKIYHLPLI